VTPKDQSGSLASGEWLKEHGLGTYNSRTRRKSLEKRVTEPVTFDHWQLVVDMGKCLACGGMLLHKRNTHTGGDFHICEHAECGWHIGYEVSLAMGKQVKLDR
jgi:hypothetical protein